MSSKEKNLVELEKVREKEIEKEEEILSNVEKLLQDEETASFSTESVLPEVQVVSVPDETLYMKIDNLILCLIVILCAIGCVSGLQVGAIMWGRFRK